MNLSRPSHAPARYVGIGLVVVLHLAAVYALSVGLMKPAARPKEPTILLPPLPDKPIQPEDMPQTQVKAEKPQIMPIKVPDVPLPDDWKEAPTVVTQPWHGELPASTEGATPGPVTTAPARAFPDASPRSAGAVCAVMPRPEVPAVSWAGEAILQVVATVRGGRVVGSELRVAQGAMDAKTRRSLQRAVESALAGYQCQGDAVFQQEFAFRID